MTQTSVSLQDQIALAERRVRVAKLQLKVAVQGLRTIGRRIVSGPGGLVAVFLTTAVLGILGWRKLTPRRGRT